MHAHGTAVLDRTAEATASVDQGGACARDQWVAKCESELANALTTHNADLLPVLAPAVFVPRPDLCPDCHGTGYSHYDLDLCSCMAGQRPAYDFPRYSSRDEAGLAIIGISHQTPAGQADVWVPCQHCDILPTKPGPYCKANLIQVPWVPACPACNDTGWAFSQYTTAWDAFYGG